MKVGIIGAGAWGTALAYSVCRSVKENVILWSFDGQIADFDSVKTPTNLHVTQNIGDLADTEIWIAVTPSAFFRETMQKSREFYNGQHILICTKGMEPKTHNFMSEILREIFPADTKIGVLSGPQFAAEVAKQIPTGSTLACTPDMRDDVHAILKDMYLTDSEDVLGAQICGVGKNATALVCGYMSVIARGENERALVFTRVWNEIVRIGIELGAKHETFLDFCGLGDLFLSATSATSRNYSAGIAIAKKQKIEGTVEGISAIHGLIHKAKKLGVDIPILTDLYQQMSSCI